MVLEKKTLSLEDIEAQAALELPDREMLALVDVVIFVNDVQVTVIEDVNANVAANICGNIVAENVRCEIQQNIEE